MRYFLCLGLLLFCVTTLQAQTQGWQNLGTLNGVTENAPLVGLHDKLYLFTASSVVSFDPSTGSTAFLGSSRQGLAFTLNNKAYVVASDGQVHVYQPNTWSTAASFPGQGAAAGRGVAAATPTMGYVITPGYSVIDVAGVPTAHYPSELWAYDPGSNVWTQKATPPSFRDGVAFTLDGKLYAGLGLYAYSGVTAGNHRYYAPLHVYDPLTDTWAKAADVPVLAKGASAFVIDGSAYIGLGNYEQTASANTTTGYPFRMQDNLYKYTPATGEVEGIGAFPLARSFAASAVLNGKGYVAGGQYLNTTFAQLRDYTDIWEFDITTYLPDFKAETLHLSQAAGKGGQVVLASTTVSNNHIGNSADAQLAYYYSADTTWSANDVHLATITLEAMYPGELRQVETPLTIPLSTASSGYVLAVADLEDAVEEAEEGNNATSAPFTLLNPSWEIPALVHDFEFSNDDHSSLQSPHAVAQQGNIVAVAANNRVFAFSRNTGNGQLTLEDTYASSSLTGTKHLAVAGANSSANVHIYATSGSSNTLVVLEADASTGNLTRLETFTHNSGGVLGMDEPAAVTISPGGAHVYVASVASKAITIFSRDINTGQLVYEGFQSATNGFNTPFHAHSPLALSADGTFLYTGELAGTLQVFARNAATGGLSYASEFSQRNQDFGLSFVNGLVLHPSAPIAYAVSPAGLHVFNRNPATGALSYLQGIKPPHQLPSTLTDLQGLAFVAGPTQDYLALSFTGSGGHAVGLFLIDESSHLPNLVQLLEPSQGAAGTLSNPFGLAATADGRSLYVTGQGSNSVHHFSLFGAEGRLLPDLAVKEYSKLTTTMVAGGKYTVSYRVKNLGHSPAHNIPMASELSPNAFQPALTDSYPYTIPKLAVGADTLVTLQFFVPGSPLTYQAYTDADPQNTIAELSTANNRGITSALAANPSGLPELAVTLFKPSTRYLTPDVTAIDVTVRVVNKGGSFANGAISFDLKVVNNNTGASVGGLIGTTDIIPTPSLDPGQWHEESFTLNVPAASLAPGLYRLEGTLDKNNNIAEANEANNTVRALLQVPGAGSPQPHQGLADLGVQLSAASPSPVEPGQVLTLSGRVYNMGFATVPASNTALYWWQLGQNNTTPLTLIPAPSLASGESFCFDNIEITVPSSLNANATYYILADVDYTGQLPEAIESNNHHALEIEVETGDIDPPTYIDLAIQGPTLLPTTPVMAGATLQVSFLAANLGTGNAGASTTHYSLATNNTSAGTFLQSQALQALTAGGSAAINNQAITLPATLAPGSYYLRVALNGNDALTESSTANNVAYLPFTVESSTVNGPDLEFMIFETDQPTASPGDILNGQVDLANYGDALAAASVIYFWLNTTNDQAGGLLLTTLPVPSLGGGASTGPQQVNIPLPATIANGTYYIIAQADATQLVAETVEENNVASAPLEVSGDDNNPSPSTCETWGHPLPQPLASYQLPNGQGYATGNNQFGDRALANYASPGSLPQYLTGIMLQFEQVTGGLGTVEVAVWDGSTGQPGGLLYIESIAMSQLLTSFNGVQPYTLTLANPFQVSAPIFAGLTLPDLVGDTVALLAPLNGTVPLNTAWTQASSGQWLPFDHPDNWQVSTTLGIHPIFCTSLTTGLGSQGKPGSLQVQVFPNPAKNQCRVQLPLALPAQYALYNATGKKVSSGQASGRAFQLQLTTVPPGVYHLHVIQGQATAVTRLIKN